MCVTAVTMAVSYRVDDAAAGQADELRGRVAERPTEVSHEAARVYSTHAGATLHVLHSPGRRTRLPVSLSVRDDRL